MQHTLAAVLRQAGGWQPQPQLLLAKTRIRCQQPVHITLYSIKPAAA